MRKQKIEQLKNTISYLKNKKLSSGLNAHDIEIYENAKKELAFCERNINKNLVFANK